MKMCALSYHKIASGQSSSNWKDVLSPQKKEKKKGGEEEEEEEEGPIQHYSY
jgi:hypothetical protein